MACWKPACARRRVAFQLLADRIWRPLRHAAAMLALWTARFAGNARRGAGALDNRAARVMRRIPDATDAVATYPARGAPWVTPSGAKTAGASPSLARSGRPHASWRLGMALQYRDMRDMRDAFSYLQQVVPPVELTGGGEFAGSCASQPWAWIADARRASCRQEKSLHDWIQVNGLARPQPRTNAETLAPSGRLSQPAKLFQLPPSQKDFRRP